MMASYTDEQLNAELEKLQQNITLTLQAIDQNFAKCHQTIATRIIPQVEKYADASQGVWNGSKVNKLSYEEISASLDSSKTSLQVSDDPERSNRPPLGTKSSVNGSPIAGQWSEHDDLQSPWERLRREMNLEAMSDTMSAGHTTPRNKGRANSIHTPSQSVQSNKLLGKVLNKHFKSGSNIAPRADASSVTSSVPKPTILMSDTTSSKGSPGINLSRVDHMSADEGEDGRPNQGYSPPRTIQFAVPHSQLVKTPAKEAAQMIVDDIMLTSGASPPAKVWKQSRREDDRPPSVSYVSSSSVAEEEDLSQHSTVDSWAMRSEQRNQDNVMMEGMGESAQQGLDPSEQFETMLGRRKTKTTASEKLNSPCPPGLWLDGNHTSSPGRSRFQLPGSPNLQRVYDPFNDTPRKQSASHKMVKLTHANQPDTFDDGNDMLRKTGKLVDEDTLENYTQGMEQDFPFRTVSSEGDDNTGFVSHMPPSHNIMEASSLAGSDLGAGYELSGVLPIKASAAGSPKPSEASITMTTGFSGQIPARFSLEYFPSLFQSPPGSTQLTRVYNTFAEANGKPLNIEDVLEQINDPTYNRTSIELLVDLLVRKRFIKREKHGWRLRV
ncbi:hypothetical protein INT43_003040 [Umbelopsis isabellina]|uniref:DASH complex subunit ASK1 n=1 Tax=Mortierella isabellina TaxID=91625 RepID=A0A8H7PPZ0_MORIS|nr:hypothetical protein INT43_003040 [Umbelopsis isabellina]